jgi:hypothetical protein
MQGVKPMADSLAITHGHANVDEPMRAASDERIDGLRVREFVCACGFVTAVLNRVEDEEPGARWPLVLQPLSQA